ncbi:MAG: hypothetical protein IT319_04925 [Anaerolineae bacterium]|nr:hypothetical protein [Anaerolineae bacterium]
MDNLPEDDNLYEIYDAPDEPQRYWTARRILLLILVLIMVIALLAYSYYGLFVPPPPPPTLAPGSLI